MRGEKNINVYALSLTFFYTWIMVEGALRKWFLTALATPLFFIKYIIAGIILMIFIINREKISKTDFPFIGTFFFLVFYGLLQIFNLHVTNMPLLGIIGCLVHFGFSPIMFTLPKAIDHEMVLNKILSFINILFIGIFLLGIYQYFSPPGAWINKYVSDDLSIALVGGHVRITTLFSYIAPYSVLLNFIILILFFQLVQLRKLNLGGGILIAAFGLGIINAFMTGSRSLVFMSVIQITIVFFVYASRADFQRFKKLVLNFLLFLLVGFGVVAYTESGSTALDSFKDRVEGNSDIEGRVYDSLDPFKFLDRSGLIGFGIGTTYNANARFITQRWKMPGYWEEESERIVIELGLIGFIISFIFRTSVVFFGYKTFKKTKNPNLQVLALVLTVHMLPALIFFNQLTFNWMENILFWTDIGLLVCINKIDKRESVFPYENHRLAAG